MKSQDKGERRLRPLSDRQWDRIKRASGLPPVARKSIELAICSYMGWHEEDPAIPPAKIKEKLRKLKNQARELLKGFEEAIRPDDVYFALVRVRDEWHPRNAEQRKNLAGHARTEKVRADLNALINWLDQSERALSRRKPGPPVEEAQNVYLLVDSIDNALCAYTNKGLARSEHHRTMMEEIFTILDREVGRGTIDTAMRQVIAASRRSAGKLRLPGSRV